MPNDTLPAFDSCVSSLIITSEISAHMLSYKASALLKIRRRAYPLLTADPTLGDESRIFNTRAYNAQNNLGQTYRHMTNSRTASGLSALLTLPVTEVVMYLQQTMLQNPVLPPALPPKTVKKAPAAAAPVLTP